ncbi:hypothetical protein HDF16_002652 [Granulicella aggregans]|uniref:Uncharacterized protein n=1 Tax=Granulicella aggregans TaxID=474949 RepID=A0A7W8E3Y5_9BACT|nr:hypothetical protein [Granulicella aggregans]
MENFHANTQTPKVIGLLGIHQLNGKPEPLVSHPYPDYDFEDVAHPGDLEPIIIRGIMNVH